MSGERIKLGAISARRPKPRISRYGTLATTPSHARARFVSDPRVDWPRVVRDLEGERLTPAAIGQRVGHSKKWVLWMRDGHTQQPRFVSGCRLLRLWADALRRPMNEAPRLA